MTYLDLARVYTGDFYLPWNGVEWLVRELPAQDAVELRSILLLPEFTPDVEVAWIKRILGHAPEAEDYDRQWDTWLDLIEAGIGWCSLMHLGRTALIHMTSTPEAGKAHWNGSQVAALLLDLNLLESKRAESEQVTQEVADRIAARARGEAVPT